MSDREWSSGELRKAAVGGARWTAAARLIAEPATFAGAIVLARLVEPAGFGHAAFALIVIAVAAVLGPAGFIAPLIQRRELSSQHSASVAFVVVVAGCVLTIATAAFGKFVAPSFLPEETSNLIVLASFAWILVGLGGTSQALLQRTLRFRTLAAIEATSAVAAVVVSILAAVFGLQGAAVVLGGLGLIGTVSVISVVAAPPPFPRLTRAAVADLHRFGFATTGSALLFLAYRNIDYAILSVRASPAQVGYYWRAYQLGVGYQVKISRVMLRVALPIYSRAATLEELQHLRSRIVRTHATVLIPILATFVGVAPILVPWLFGPSWQPAVVPAQIMALAGMADAVTVGLGSLMIALQRARELVVWNVVQLVTFTILVLVLAPFGITALAVGVAGFGVFNVLAIQLGLLNPYAGLPLHQLWKDIRAGCAAGVVALCATALTRIGLEDALPDVVLLLVLGAVAFAGVAGVLRLGFRDEAEDVLRVVGRRRRGREAGP